jgi:hypothetical protein
VITGLVPDGGQCLADLDCAPSSACELERCAPRPGAGFACSHVCGPGLSCSASICVPSAGGFEPCVDDEDCADLDCDELAGRCRRPFACRRS